MRLLLCFLCSGVGGLGGIYASYMLYKRCDTLKKMLLLINRISVMIRYRAEEILPLCRSLSMSSEFSEFSFLQNFVQNAVPNEDFRPYWMTAAESLSELSPSDKDAIKSLGESLGSSDIQGQLALLELNQTVLTARLEEAQEARQRKSKMYRSVGFLLGGAVGVMLL